MSDADHCYCVVLNAHAGVAFPSEKLEHEVSDKLPKTEEDSGNTKKTKVWIMSVLEYDWDSQNKFTLPWFAINIGKQHTKITKILKNDLWVLRSICIYK